MLLVVFVLWFLFQDAVLVVEVINLVNNVADGPVLGADDISEETDEHIDFGQLDAHSPPRKLCGRGELLLGKKDTRCVHVLVQLQQLLVEPLCVFLVFSLFRCWDPEQVAVCGVVRELFICGIGHFPVLESKDSLYNQTCKLQITLAVRMQVKLLAQSLKIQVVEARLEQPVLEQEVSNQRNCFLSVDFLLWSKLFKCLLVEYFAELTDAVRDNGDFLEERDHDGVGDVHEPGKVLHHELEVFVHLLLGDSRLVLLLVSVEHVVVLVFLAEKRSNLLEHALLRKQRLLLFCESFQLLLIYLRVPQVHSLQILHRQVVYVDALALLLEHVVNASSSLVCFGQLLEESIQQRTLSQRLHVRCEIDCSRYESFLDLNHPPVLDLRGEVDEAAVNDHFDEIVQLLRVALVLFGG